jgi:putative heme-binding domain-containing protein
VLQQVATGELETDLRFPAANILLTSNDESIRVAAQKYVSLPSSADNRPLPTLANLLRQRGDVVRGADVFANVGTCAKCHKVNGSGNEVGPDLSEVGGKLSVEALYESILNPSAGISHSYEMYTAALADGRLLSGVLVSKTADEVVLKDKDAVTHKVPMGELDEIKQQKKSLMPDDLQKLLTEQQLVDVVEYMKSLKKK